MYEIKVSPYSLPNLLSPILKINSKWIKYLNIRPETRKILQENVREMLQDIGIGNRFWIRSQKQDNKSKNGEKWHYIKLRRFCSAKEAINKRKRQPIDWEEIIANYASDKYPEYTRNSRSSTTK